MGNKVLKWNFIFQYGYVITNIINSFILLPFYVNYINEIELGLWWATGNVLAWLTLADPGIGDVLQQKIAVLLGKKEYDEISRTIGSGLISSLATFIISILIGLILYFLIDKVLNINIEHYKNLNKAFLISIFSTGITLLTFSLAGINQGMLRSKQVAIAYITSNILFFIVNIIFLILGFELMSIAIANVVRAVYLAIFNLLVMFFSNDLTKKVIIIDFNHFRSFIKIFSITSISRIISSFSNNIDLVILPRYISPYLITIFEINRRPIKMLQGLVGRYSVALMPGISNSFGTDMISTKENIRKRFKYFLIFTTALSSISILCYEQIISLWIDSSKFAGIQITILLVLNFFFGLIGYFFSNMTYAIGDIKHNSLINIIKGIVLLCSIPFSAWKFGLNGVLCTTLIVTFLIDFLMFLSRMNKLDIIKINKMIIISWLRILVINIVCLITVYYICNIFNEINLILKLFFNVISFGGILFICLIIFDSDFKDIILKK